MCSLELSVLSEKKPITSMVYIIKNGKGIETINFLGKRHKYWKVIYGLHSQDMKRELHVFTREFMYFYLFSYSVASPKCAQVFT